MDKRCAYLIPKFTNIGLETAFGIREERQTEFRTLVL